MIAEKMKQYCDESPFSKFSLKLIALLEGSKPNLTIDNVISILDNRQDFESFVIGLDPSKNKAELEKVLEYSEDYFSQLVSQVLTLLIKAKN